MTTRVIAAIIAVGFGLSGAAQSAGPKAMLRATPSTVGLSPEGLQQATAALRQSVADHAIAGAVAGVARHGKIAYLETVGFQDLSTRTPMDERTLFRIYSMTKSVTAVAVMMLQEEGKFALDDPVQKYLPEFKNVMVQPDPSAPARKPNRPITIRDLMLHTSGLSHRTSDLYKRLGTRARTDTFAQFITKITHAPLMEDPGTAFRYSESPTVLGRLVEIWSGKPFDVFLKERIFDPLGMRDTAFFAAPDAAPRLASVYAPNPDGGLTAIETEATPFTEKPALLEGAVGLLSTVPDYLAFCQMLLNRGEYAGTRLLKAETVSQMLVNGLSDSVMQSRGTVGWGLINATVQTSTASPTANEVSWDGTAGTIFWMDPQRDMTTVLMTQIQPTNPGGIRQRFKNAILLAAR
jgi:CubicO group peptidase (beta-lactamase class C family)